MFSLAIFSQTPSTYTVCPYLMDRQSNPHRCKATRKIIISILCPFRGIPGWYLVKV
jgi:hypothetical protein